MKCALVVGAAGGIGSAICRMLIRDGWLVFGGDLPEVPFDPSFAGENFEPLCIDITDPDSIEQGRMAIARTCERLDALIIASGIYDHFPLAEADAGRLRRLLDVNVAGPALLVAGLFALLHPGSRIVMISSETALVSLPFQIYGISKRMLESYLHALRQELALIGIPVVAIRPGAHDTHLFRQSRRALEEYPASSRFERFLHVVRLQGQRIMDQGANDPDQVAGAVLKSLTASNPKKVYHVNVSGRFRAMAAMPAGIRETILRSILR